jgi:tetratricopeptide (TPR) repeat protein
LLVDDKTAGTEGRSLGWVAVPAVLYLALHGFAPLLPQHFWGVDGFTYCPTPFLVFLAIALISIPAVLRIPADRWPAINARFVSLTCLLLLCVSLIVPSATQLSGDGQLHARELAGGVWDSHPRMNRAPLVFWLIHSIYHHTSELITPVDVYAWFSRLSGLVFLVLSGMISRAWAEDRFHSTILFLLLVSQGYVQLFFGYVETYAILFPAMSAYLLLCDHAQRGRVPVYVPAAVLGLMVPLHFVTLAVFPALLWVAWARPSEGLQSRTISSLGVLALPAVTLLTLNLIGLGPGSLVYSEPGSHTIPLFGDLLVHHPHRLFSFGHIVQILNQYALVAPATLICIGLLATGFDRHDPRDVMLLLAAGPLVVFTVLFNPAIGAFRDWDAFALPALPLTLLSVRCFIRGYSNGSSFRAAAILVVALSAVHTGAWACVNANASVFERRFDHLVREASISKLARAYGAASLAAHYRDTGRLTEALTAFKDASRYDPANGRYHVGMAYVMNMSGDRAGAVEALERAQSISPDRLEASINLGKLYLDLGRLSDAKSVLRQAIRRNPASVPVIRTLGLVAYREGDFDTARRLFRQVIDLDTSQVSGYIDLASAHQALGQLAQAEMALRDALELDETSVRARMNLGAVYHQRDQFSAAAAAFRSVLALDERYANAHLNLGVTLIAMGDSGSAKQHLKRVLELSPDDAEADQVRALLNQIK